MNIARTGLTRRRRRLAKTREKPESAAKPPHEPVARQDGPPATVTLELPLVTMQVRAPRIGLPHVPLEEAGLVIDAARSLLPPPERVMYYGGLGAVAAIGMIEWPVAAAIGVGTAVAQRAVGYMRQGPCRADGAGPPGGPGGPGGAGGPDGPGGAGRPDGKATAA
ncbi:MAG: hypothetical protein ACM3ML_24255 [Micromonosporaceae bacterium]